MPRPTYIHVSHEALFYNVKNIKNQAPQSQIVAVVKANAYGCGIKNVIGALDSIVDRLAVATFQEARDILRSGARTPIVILQGVFDPLEWLTAAEHHFECVLHQAEQLSWLLHTPLPSPIKIWLKVNTGMNRLGWLPEDLPEVIAALLACPWVDPNLILMTHFANMDEPAHPLNRKQYDLFFNHSAIPIHHYPISLKNSAAIFQPEYQAGDFIRPGLSLYGVSPFPNQTGQALGLKPVMRFYSAITHTFLIKPHATVGYGSSWVAKRASRIGLIPVGYGDGYPRHIAAGTPVWIKGIEVPIVGRVSMDSLTVDLTDAPDLQIGDDVELWGTQLPIERIALAAGTIPYELMTQVNRR